MNTQTPFAKRIVALGAAAGLGFCLAPLTAASAEAAEVTKPIAQDCHSNGVPLDFNADMVRDGDHVTITTPDDVKVGDEYTITVDYRPDTIIGKQQGADVIEMQNIAVRWAINDPSAFVTAKMLNNGKALTGPAKMSLVGGNRLVFSNMNVAVNGKDTVWYPPTFQVTFKATKAGKLPTLHQVVEGPAGQRNNPENWIVMDNHVKHPLLGEKTFHMNCLAVAKGGGNLEATLATVKAAPGANGATVADNKAGENKSNNGANKGSEVKGTDGKASKSNSAGSTVGSDGLIREDTDSSVDASTTNTDEGMPGWGVALIVIVCLAAVGGIGYGIYRAQQKKKKGNA